MDVLKINWVSWFIEKTTALYGNAKPDRTEDNVAIIKQRCIIFYVLRVLEEYGFGPNMNLKVQEQILGLFAMISIIIIIFNLRRKLLDSTRQTKSICMKRQH